MRRGSIWIGSGKGTFAAKPRPMLVIQGDRFERTRSLTICPITTSESEAGAIRLPVVPGSQTGLRKPSWIMVDKVTTVARSSLDREIGALSDADGLALDRALRLFLGLD